MVDTLALTSAKALSTLDEELEIELELTFIAVRAASRLDEELERLSDDV